MCRASDVILQIDSDAAFRVCEQARSRAEEHSYLSSKDGEVFNAPITVSATVIKPAMGSVAEAKVGALCLNGQTAIAIRDCSEELGHEQPAAIMRTDNQTAMGFAKGAIKEKRSRTLIVNVGGSRTGQHSHNSTSCGIKARGI